MVKCIRCVCLSHRACVRLASPFICSFCHIASDRIMLDRLNKSATPSGVIIDRSALRSFLVTLPDQNQAVDLELNRQLYQRHLSEGDGAWPLQFTKKRVQWLL
jgi:hypothetical protein